MIRCVVIIYFILVPVSEQCTDKSVRLRGGPNEFTGLLEICYKGHWGTVCNDGTFNSSAVSVICSSLGYASDGGSLLSGAVYGQGESVIWLSKVVCNGQESSLDECAHLGFGILSSSCYSHSQDINIHCQCKHCSKLYVIVCIQLCLW